jgi:cytoskeletal protein CcmA (bactofilin family)
MSQSIQKYIGFIMFTCVLFLSLAHTAFAETRREDRVVVEADEIINEDLFIGGSHVEILGEVNGDVYIGAENVEIHGLINGDLLVAAETITVTGTLNDDIRVAGKTLTLTGATINDGVTFLGERMTLGSETTVNGTILFLGDTLRVDGLINGNIRGAGDTFVVNGEVTDSLYVATRVLHFGETALVNGDVYYTSDLEATTDEGSVINGDLNWERIVIPEWRKALSFWAEPVFAFISFLGTLVVGTFLLLVFYRPVTLISKRIRERPLLSLGMGSLVFLLAFPLFLLLILTVIGIPLAFLGITLFILGLCFGGIFVALALGHFFLEVLRPKATAAPSAYLSFLVGLISLYLLYQLPLFGWLLNLIVALMGLGALLYGAQRIRSRT